MKRPDFILSQKVVSSKAHRWGHDQMKRDPGKLAVSVQIVSNVVSPTPPVVSLSASSLPPGFSWLRATYRPSDREVDTFAHLIANAEGCPADAHAARLLEEAELQLWAWRTATRKRPSKPRRESASPS